MNSSSLLLAPHSSLECDNAGCYSRLRKILSEQAGLPHEKSIDGRIQRSLAILQREYSDLPPELVLLHSIVSHTVHVVLSDDTCRDYNQFINEHTGRYPPYHLVVPDNSEYHLQLSRHMGVEGYGVGYASLIQKILG